MRQGLPLSQAAHELGVSVENLRKRCQRGAVPAYKHGSHWFVLLPQPGQPQDENQDAKPDSARTDQDTDLAQQMAILRELVDTLQADVSYLRQELSARSEELRRKDYIIADLSRRLPELPISLSPASAPPPDTPQPLSAAQRWWQNAIRVGQ